MRSYCITLSLALSLPLSKTVLPGTAIHNIISSFNNWLIEWKELRRMTERKKKLRTYPVFIFLWAAIDNYSVQTNRTNYCVQQYYVNFTIEPLNHSSRFIRSLTVTHISMWIYTSMYMLVLDCVCVEMHFQLSNHVQNRDGKCVRLVPHIKCKCEHITQYQRKSRT